MVLNIALQLQPVHPRLRPAGVGASASTSRQLGFSPQYASQVPKDQARFPRINLTGYISNGSTNENRPVNNHTVASTLTKSAGAHSIRTGFEFRVYQEADQFFEQPADRPVHLRFHLDARPARQLGRLPGQHRTIGGRAPARPAGFGQHHPLSRTTSSSPVPGASSCRTTGRSRRKLTLNLGLRYEFETPLHERFNRSTLGFDPNYVQPISAAAQATYANIYPNISGGFPQLPPSAFALKGGMTFAGVNGNDGSLYNTPKNVFMPRLGLAYQLDNKTVLRTGFGMFAGFLGERRGDVHAERLHARTPTWC